MNDYTLEIEGKRLFYIDGVMRALYEDEGITDPQELEKRAHQAAIDAGFDPQHSTNYNFPVVPFDKAGRYCGAISYPWSKLFYLIRNPGSLRSSKRLGQGQDAHHHQNP